ncbi:MAG: hypothetical protein F4X92_07350 [Gammaproteobacteria bacterium]|nr:hypothetical protein [Gammaproteobacteria bacterium]
MRLRELTLPGKLLPAFLAIAGICPGAVPASDTVPAGRYLDLSVRVDAPEQLNPLRMIGDLQFSDRVSVGEAVRTALAGTGYRLAGSAHPVVQALLDSRVALPHMRFENKRIDSVIGAIVGTGRGYDVQVDHAARLIRVVPSLRQGMMRQAGEEGDSPEPAPVHLPDQDQ